jgi:RNA polymerase sigma factor (sigma-70 family)
VGPRSGALTRVGLRWKKVLTGNPAAYARTTLIRLNIDRVRRLRREHLVSEVPEGIFDCEASWTAEPWLADALRELSPRQRTVIGLRFVLDMDLSSIANELGCSTGTVKAHLYRGLESLREAQRRPDSSLDVPGRRERRT